MRSTSNIVASNLHPCPCLPIAQFTSACVLQTLPQSLECEHWQCCPAAVSTLPVGTSDMAVTAQNKAQIQVWLAGKKKRYNHCSHSAECPTHMLTTWRVSKTECEGAVSNQSVLVRTPKEQQTSMPMTQGRTQITPNSSVICTQAQSLATSSLKPRPLKSISPLTSLHSRLWSPGETYQMSGGLGF